MTTPRAVPGTTSSKPHTHVLVMYRSYWFSLCDELSTQATSASSRISIFPALVHLWV